MKLHAALARALAGHGVHTMFGLIGDGNLFFAHSFAQDGREFVAAAHEAGAMFMGFGYASLTGRLGVVTVTHGAALTVRGDAATVADALSEALDLLNVPRREFRTTTMAARIADQAVMGERPETATGTVDVEWALRRLNEILPQRRVVVSDAGRFMMETSRHIHPGDPWAYVLPVNFGSIGMGMGAPANSTRHCRCSPGPSWRRWPRRSAARG